MKTKEAIEFINIYTCNAYGSWDINTRYKKEKVIELLQRGGKFEQILEELEKKYGNRLHCYPIQNERGYTGNEVEVSLNNIIYELKQKYFPKETK